MPVVRAFNRSYIQALGIGEQRKVLDKFAGGYNSKWNWPA
jgi:hypothetical protein